MADDGLPAPLVALLDRVNAKRRKLLLTRDDVAQTIQEALSSDDGIAVRHGGAEILGKTTLCVAIKPPKRQGVVVGVAMCSADRPTPGRAWSELGPWQQDFARNAEKAHKWAAVEKPDRVFVGVAKAKAAGHAKATATAANPKEGAKLLAQILANPADDQARMVYADWLTEQGDPRGELITVQMALAGKPTAAQKRQLRVRESELLKKHERTWAKEVMQDGREYEIRKGFVAMVKMTGNVWGAKGARLFQYEPIEELIVNIPNGAGLKAIANAAHTAKLHQIRFESVFWMQNAKDADALTAFFSSEYVGAVPEIRVFVQHDRLDLTKLFVGSKLAQTRRLGIAFHGGLQDAYAQLAHLECPALEELLVGTNAKETLSALKKVFGNKVRYLYE